MKIIRHISLAALLIATLSSVSAQENGAYNESVVVKGSYRPVIEQQTKLSFPAVVTDTLGRLEHDFSYSISPSRLRALYEPSRIKAARIIGEPATKLYNNYLRLGFGNYWTPLADLYWSSTRDKKKTYGIRINHLSSWDKLPDYGPNHFGNTGVTLFGKYIVADKLQLATDVSYEHDHNLYYGFTDSTLQAVMGTSRDGIYIADYRASYNLAQWNIGLRNMQLDPNKLGYAVNVHLSDLWGVYGQNEFNANIGGDIHYGFNIKDQYKGIAYLRLEWDHYNNLTPDNEMPLGYLATQVGDKFAGNIVKINPYIDFIFRGLQFRTGLLAGWDGYSARGSAVKKTCFFPDVTVSKKLMRDNLVLSLAATGGIEASSLNSLRLVNPYITPNEGGNSALLHYDFIAHARWTLSKKLEANAEVGYSLLRNDIIFAIDPDYSLGNVFLPQNIDDNRLTAGATISFVNDEMLTLRAGGHYYNYNIVGESTLTRMPYRPDWDALLAADVNYHDKWIFHLEGRLLGNMVGSKFQSGSATPSLVNTEVLPVRYGVAAEVEYRHNRALSFFLRMDNLAFQRYWYWDNYPSQRGLFIAGLTYTIPHK
ncbi:MAG: TonB-dependent receptor [Bacteroidales bacterium]|nr:TonB-dependent receptor [Bacteroidales bacterium]